MTKLMTRPSVLLPLAALALPFTGLAAQEQQEAQQQEPQLEGAVPQSDDVLTTVTGSVPDDLSDMTKGPDIDGIILARKGERIKVTTADGASTIVAVSEGTEIKARKGLFGAGRSKLTADSLLNGLPVSIKTVEWGGGLVARQISLKNADLKTASMIRNGTAQGFSEQTAATEALRGRMADIDKYNVKSTTNVNFDTGKWALTDQAKTDLCTAASQAQATENALLLVVGYTDSVGSEEYNQVLSERRASGVVNYLQQKCGWKPYRMLTPTGMAEADPAASNDTWEGKAQNRRVSVNVLVSKSVEGL